MKSQSELSWVFILIAGAIILTFFTGFAFKYKSLQEEKLTLELLTSLESSLSSLKSSPYNTFDKIDLPRDLEVTCNGLKINGRSYKTNNLLFSQKILKNKMLIYYKPFKFPFKITDFYLISDSNRKFHIIYDSSAEDYIKVLINDLPGELRNKFTYSTIKSNNINTRNVEIKNLDNNKVKVDNYGVYLDNNLVYAAIFSENFSCMNEKINMEIDKTVKIYKNKISTLSQQGCNYLPFLNYLNNLRNDLSNSKQIDILNQELDSRSCPTLY